MVVAPTQIKKPPPEEPEVDPRLTPSEKEWLKAAREEEAQEKESAAESAKNLEAAAGDEEGEGGEGGAEAGGGGESVAAVVDKKGVGVGDAAGAASACGSATSAATANAGGTYSGKGKGKAVQGAPTTSTANPTTTNTGVVVGGGNAEGGVGSVAATAAEASDSAGGAMVVVAGAGAGAGAGGREGANGGGTAGVEKLRGKDGQVVEAGGKGEGPPPVRWSPKQLTEFDEKRDALELKVGLEVGDLCVLGLGGGVVLLMVRSCVASCIRKCESLYKYTVQIMRESRAWAGASEGVPQRCEALHLCVFLVTGWCFCFTCGCDIYENLVGSNRVCKPVMFVRRARG